MNLHSVYEKMPEGIKKIYRGSRLHEKVVFRTERKKKDGNMRKISGGGYIFYDEGVLYKHMNKEKYHSQFGQDFFLDKVIFGGKAEGFFIDIGANHPSKLSNTLYFEQLGWNGIAFEPQTKLCELWKERKVKCYNLALGDKNCELEFAEFEGDDELNTLAGVASVLGSSASWKKYLVKQRRLSDVLKEIGVRTVDFVSLDVEGYEMNVLRGIDFRFADIRCFLIENNKGKYGMASMEIRNFMDKKGYDFIGRIVIDDVFIKRKI